jgi:hypothetical protein
MKARTGFILLLVWFIPATLKSQQTMSPDSLLNKLTGKWVLKGTIDGQNTVHDLDVQRVLNGQYVQLSEVSREKDQKGNPLYEAIVYICWEESKKQYSCLWLDNTGNGGISNGITGRADQNGNNIELIFKYGEASRFHTTFLYDRNSDTWQWLMDAETDGKLEPFARAILTRSNQIN